MDSNKRNNLLIGTLCALVLIMAVAYAVANTSLNINATTKISSTWDIAITGIDKTVTGGASDTDYTYNALTASFYTKLKSPGDSILYKVKVTNNGDTNAILNGIDKKITNSSEYIDIVFSGLDENDTLNAGETKTLNIKVTFKEVGEGNFINTINTQIKVTLDFIQA